jgi:hypothetical protein
MIIVTTGWLCAKRSMKLILSLAWARMFTAHGNPSVVTLHYIILHRVYRQKGLLPFPVSEELKSVTPALASILQESSSNLDWGISCPLWSVSCFLSVTAEKYSKSALLLADSFVFKLPIAVNNSPVGSSSIDYWKCRKHTIKFFCEDYIALSPVAFNLPAYINKEAS